MKKLITLSVLMLMVAMLNAQVEVTKFLGIPVDGTKYEMISKLKAKGYTWNSTYEWLEGEFNGRDVIIRVVTNNNKVYRILVVDKIYSNETEIRIRFNKLLSQFEKNERYLSELGALNEPIEDDEDISYNISVKNKRYEASFIQFDKRFFSDSTYIINQTENYLRSKYSEEELTNIKEIISEDENVRTQILTEVFQYWFSNNNVWFMIGEKYGKYRIFLFYDNNNNAANGEDL